MKIIINTVNSGISISVEALYELILMNSDLVIKEKRLPPETDYSKKYEQYFNEKYNEDTFLEILFDEVYEYYLDGADEIRTHPDLISVIEKLGPRADGKYSDLKIIDIPDGISYYIFSDDVSGESVHEEHRIWY